MLGIVKIEVKYQNPWNSDYICEKSGQCCYKQEVRKSGKSGAFAFSLPVFVLFQLTADLADCRLLMRHLDQLWGMESAGAVRISKMKEAVGVISILRSCMLEINELNFGFLFPLVVMHAASACNLPFAIVQATEERAFYCSIFLVDVGCLVAIAICGRFICYEVDNISLH